MVRDFHARELPLHHNPREAYVLPSLFPPAGISTWSSIFQEAKRVIDTCVRKGHPGFSANGLARTSDQDWMPVGIFLWATDSLIAGDYRDDTEHSGQEGGNATVATA